MLTLTEQDEVRAILAPILAHPDTEQMKRYIQHGSVSTYDHCMKVALSCAEYVRRHGCLVDYEALIRAAFLHDFYLYDWHTPGDGSHHLHGFRHPRRAMDNAAARFDLSEKEKAIIFTHMWPLIPFRFPRSREGWIVALCDKKVSTRETLDGIRERRAKKSAGRRGAHTSDTDPTE